MRKFAIGLCSILLLSWLLAGAALANQHIQIQDVPGGMTLLDQSRDRVDIKVEVGSIDIVDVWTKEGNFNMLTASGLSRSFDIGAPNLPVSGQLINVPFGAEIKAEVVYSEVEEISLSALGLTNPLMPAQPSLSKSDDPMSVPFEYNSGLYAQSAFYSQPLVQTEVLGTMRGVRLATVTVSPFEYNPVEGILRVHKNVEVRVTFEDADWQRTQELQDKLYSPAFRDLMEMPINAESSARSSRADLVQYPIKYLIISDRMFEAQLEPLIEWKVKKGFKVVTAFTDVIGSTNTAIKAYIEGVFDADTAAGEVPPSFILLVGDDQQIPAFNSQFGHGHITDLYFGEMDGGGDYYPDIYYGRMSAQNPAQLQPQIDKTLEYEQYLLPDPSYLEEITLVSGVDGSFASVWGNGQLNYGTTYYFNAAHGITPNVWLYPASDASGAASAIIQTVSDGVSLYNYTAHCSHSGHADPPFTTADLPGLTNWHQYLLGIGNCCLPNTFGDDYTTPCFGEAFLQMEDRGGIGYIGATNSTYWDEDYWWGVGYGSIVVNPTYEATTLGAYDGIYHDHGEPVEDHYVTNSAIVFAGNLGVSASTSSRKTYYWEAYMLMGDPSLISYLGVPTANDVVHEATCLLTATSFAVTADPGSYVAISLNGELQGAAYVDETGQVDVPLIGFSTVGTCDIVVSCQFREPYISTVQVISPSGPYVIFDAAEVNDATGNNNAQLDFGEDILLGLTLKNVGPDAAYDVVANLSSTDPYIDITDATEAYGTVPPDMATSFIADGFAFSVDPLVPDGRWITFDLEVTGTARDTWNGTFRLQAHAPNVAYVSVAINDAVGGNGNGKLDPGESAQLTVTIQNQGTGQAFNAEAFLGTSDANITIGDNYGVFGFIDAGATVNNAGDVFEVSAAESCPMGHATTLAMDLGADGGYAATLYIGITVGDRVVAFADDFAMDLGWTGYGGTAEWERGAAQGLQDDPDDDHTAGASNWIAGNDLSGDGDYNNNISSTQYLTSPIIDLSGFYGTELRFWQWLGVESSSYDHVNLQVYDGTGWVTLYSHSGSTFQETAWSEKFYDIGQYADSNAMFQIRFGMGSTDGSVTYSGWNIDDIEIKGYGHVGTPIMLLSEESLDMTLLPGGTADHGIWIHNDGDGTLRVAFTTDEPWISCSTDDIFIGENDSTEFMVTLDCGGYESGQYTGELEYVSNDAINPTGTIPVTMRIGCCQGASVGNVDGSADFEVTLSDLTALIDALFVSLTPPDCLTEADLDYSGQPDPTPADVTLGDLTLMVDHLFLTLSPLNPCP